MSNTTNPVTLVLSDLQLADKARRFADGLETARQSLAVAANCARFLAPRAQVLEPLRDAHAALDGLHALASPALSARTAHLLGVVFAASRLANSSKLDFPSPAGEAVGELLDGAFQSASLLVADARDEAAALTA